MCVHGGEVCQTEWNDKEQPKLTLHLDSITEGRAQALQYY